MFAIASAIYLIIKNLSVIPVLKGFFNAVILGQSFKMISLAIRSGLPTRESFELASNMMNERRWKSAFILISEEIQDRGFYDCINDLSGFISPTDMLIIKSTTKGGNIESGIDFVGEKKIENSYAMLESITPLIQIGAFFFVVIQIVAVMSPLYLMIFQFANKAG